VVLEHRIVELALPLEGAIGPPVPLAQQRERLIHHRDKVQPPVLPAWYSVSVRMRECIIA
jgi:hypothetical protein